MSSASLVPAGRLQGTGSRTSQDELLNQGGQQASESTRCARQSRHTKPCPAAQVGTPPREAPLQGAGGPYLCGGWHARPAGAQPPPLGDLAGKPPDAELTGLPERGPAGGQSSLSLFSPPPWHPGLSQAPSLPPTSPSDLPPPTLLQPPGPSLSSSHSPSSVLPLHLGVCCSLYLEHPAWPLHALLASAQEPLSQRGPHLITPAKVNSHHPPTLPPWHLALFSSQPLLQSEFIRFIHGPPRVMPVSTDRPSLQESQDCLSYRNIVLNKYL